MFFEKIVFSPENRKNVCRVGAQNVKMKNLHRRTFSDDYHQQQYYHRCRRHRYSFGAYHTSQVRRVIRKLDRRF